MSTRILDPINTKIEAIMASHIEGPKAFWDTSVVAVPNGNGSGMSPAVLLTIGIPHHLLGKKLAGQSVIPTIFPSDDLVDKITRDLLNGLINLRAEDMKLKS